eukprot:1158882-Pelagomonas_calceolata.AAC.4
MPTNGRHLKALSLDVNLIANYVLLILRFEDIGWYTCMGPIGGGRGWWVVRWGFKFWGPPDPSTTP